VGTFFVEFTVTDSHGLSDPTPAQVAVAVVEANQAPVSAIFSPDYNPTIRPGESVNFQGFAADSDGNAPLSYLWDFGGGAPNRTVEDPGLVTFPNAGTYVVTFHVTDARGKSDPTPATVTVVVTTAPNQAPIARLALSPSAGNAPLPITLQGSGSSDPDGMIAFYRFDFGDGTTVGPSRTTRTFDTYVYVNWNARLTVTDNRGATQTTTAPVLVAPVTAGPNLVGNPSAETDLNGWIGYSGGTLQRLPGGFDRAFAIGVVGPASTATFGLNDSPNWVAQVPAANAAYRFSAWVRSPSSRGSAQLQVREWYGGNQVGAATLSPPQGLKPTWQLLTADHTPQRKNSTLDLQVLDLPVAQAETLIVDNLTIKLASAYTGLGPPDPGSGIAAKLIPNPMSGSGEIDFSLSHSGRAGVQILDLGGRVVRTLLDERQLGTGVHQVRFGGQGSNGPRLASGIYFYRVTTSAGTVTRRFAIMK